MHYHLAPPMYAWTRLAPLPVNPIDYVQPWAQPDTYVDAKAQAAEVKPAEDAVSLKNDEELDTEEPEPLSDFD